MIGKLTTPEQIRAKGYGAWKYVRVKGEYRIFDLYIDHCDMVDQGEKAESAGFIQYFDGRVKFDRRKSSTLDLGQLPEDYEAIAKLLQAEIVSE